LVEASYNTPANFPHGERFGLVAQIQRAVIFVPANISEGYGRWNGKESARFLSIASGSLCEPETHFVVPQGLGSLSARNPTSLFQAMDELAHNDLRTAKESRRVLPQA